MKILKGAAIFVAAVVLGAGLVQAAGQKILVVGESFPPFEYKNDKGEVIGIDVDISRMIFKKLGVDVEYKINPWARTWSMIEEGKADAVFTTSRKDKRKPFLYYPTEDMWKSEFVFFVKKGASITDDGYASAAGKSIGVVRGNSYHDSFWAAFPHSDAEKTKLHANLKESKDLASNFRKLAAGRIDIVIADRTVGLATAKEEGLLDKVSAQSSVLFGKGYPMPFAKKSSYAGIEELSQKFEKELAALKASGEYQKIMDKWLK
ncbi:MAG: transporter substrate-binding domain-containing protein [Sneathiella sp.]